MHPYLLSYLRIPDFENFKGYKLSLPKIWTLGTILKSDIQ